jgi:restriction endonuclease Mrr
MVSHLENPSGWWIDGSFELDHEIYLLEAKWHQDPCPEADLLVFRGKIEGKSKYTRGVFVSINGISKEAAVTITRGKQPIFFVIDGYDLTMLLEDNMELTSFLRLRQRLLAEEGRVIVPFSELASSR